MSLKETVRLISEPHVRRYFGGTSTVEKGDNLRLYSVALAVSSWQKRS